MTQRQAKIKRSGVGAGKSKNVFWPARTAVVSAETFRIKYLHAVLLHASAGFEVGADALAGAFLEFWELSAAGLNDGLDLLLGLLGDGNHPIQILIHKQTHKHLQENSTAVGEQGERKIK